MTETASVHVPMEQLIQFVTQLGHESRVQIIAAAMGVSVDEEMLEEPGIEELNIGQLESGVKPRLICPHVGCEAMFPAENLRIVAAYRRVESPYDVHWVDIERGIGVIRERNEYEMEHEPKRLGQVCPECGRPVGLPAKWKRIEV